MYSHWKALRIRAMLEVEDAMSNRKSRRRAAAVRRHAKPASAVERRQLVSRVGLVLGAIAAVIIFFAVSQMLKG